MNLFIFLTLLLTFNDYINSTDIKDEVCASDPPFPLGQTDRAYPGDCTRFVRCHNGPNRVEGPTVRDCDAGTFWSIPPLWSEHSCNVYNTSCDEHDGFSVVNFPECDGVEVDCSIGRVYFPDPNTCDGYIRCDTQKTPQPMSCNDTGFWETKFASGVGGCTGDPKQSDCFKCCQARCKNGECNENFICECEHGFQGANCDQCKPGFQEPDCVPILVDCSTFDGVKVAGQCLIFFQFERETWDDSKKTCVAIGAKLASFTYAKDVLRYVQSTFKDQQFWVGASDKKDEGSFVWLNGSPVGDIGWTTGQPDDLNGQDCLVVNKWDGYDDQQCNITHAYICEMEDYGETQWRPSQTPHKDC